MPVVKTVLLSNLSASLKVAGSFKESGYQHSVS